MDSAVPWTLLLLFTVMGTSTHADLLVVDCDEMEQEKMFLFEGESLRFIPDGEVPLQTQHFTWYWNNSQDVLTVSTEETENIHSHGPALFVLNATQEHSGCFLAREGDPPGPFTNHYFMLSVVGANSTDPLYSEVENADQIKYINCPDPVREFCRQLNGNLSWYKDGVPLQVEHEDRISIPNAKKEDEGMYSCVCSWSHQQHQYWRYGSRLMRIKDPLVYRATKILSPSVQEQLADEGDQLMLNCTVYCGTNVPEDHCKAWWRSNTTDLNGKPGFTKSKLNSTDGSETKVTQILTIARVSAADFQEQFQCMGQGSYDGPVSFTVHLKRRQSMAPLVAVGVCVFLFSVLMAAMVKWFAIDLALLFRRFLPYRLGDSDVKVFDAYVVYQLQMQDKSTEDSLCRFVSQDLPHVLEDKCGYRLFIHGRDDLPGEDRLELVEERMRKSRRLIVILTPGSGSEVTETYHRPEGYDWQVGLHQALVQRDLSVILIQLGDTGPGGYSHLPPGLQHLIQRSAPIRWPQETRAAKVNSCFWKRVRYLMPATPVRRHLQSMNI